MTRYSIGARTEHEFMRYAEETFACSAHRTAGSHGLVDVIIIPIYVGLEDKRAKLDRPIVAQLKRSKDKPDQPWKEYQPVGVAKWWVNRIKGSRTAKWRIQEG